jgi:hypothetical protein
MNFQFQLLEPTQKKLNKYTKNFYGEDMCLITKRQEPDYGDTWKSQGKKTIYFIPLVNQSSHKNVSPRCMLN